MMRLRPPLSLVLSIPYFESFESTPLSFVPPEVLDMFLLPEFPLPLNRFGITYERRFGPHASALALSVSTPAPAPPVSAHFPIAIHKIKCSTLNDHLIYNCVLPLFVSHLLCFRFCSFICLYAKGFSGSYPIQNGGRPYLMRCQL